MTHLTRRTFLTATATALGAVTLAQPARAATHTVNIQGHSFSPANLTISAGDTVTFINKDGAPHTATADNGSFDTGRLGRNDSASLTFVAPSRPQDAGRTYISECKTPDQTGRAFSIGLDLSTVLRG